MRQLMYRYCTYKSERGRLVPVLRTVIVVRAAQERVAWSVKLPFQCSLCALHRIGKRSLEFVRLSHNTTCLNWSLYLLCSSLFQALLNNSHYYHMAKHGDLKKVLFTYLIFAHWYLVLKPRICLFASFCGMCSFVCMFVRKSYR